MNGPAKIGNSLTGQITDTGVFTDFKKLAFYTFLYLFPWYFKFFEVLQLYDLAVRHFQSLCRKPRSFPLCGIHDIDSDQSAIVLHFGGAHLLTNCKLHVYWLAWITWSNFTTWAPFFSTGSKNKWIGHL